MATLVLYCDQPLKNIRKLLSALSKVECEEKIPMNNHIKRNLQKFKFQLNYQPINITSCGISDTDLKFFISTNVGILSYQIILSQFHLM